VRIKSIRIQNFRAFADETIGFDAYTSLVGENGAGKSTVLCALNVFFREKSNATDVQALSVEDFHQKNVAEAVRITVVFHDMSDAAKNALAHYVRGDELRVSAVAEFDRAKGNAPVRQVGVRMVMRDFAPFFDAENRTAANGYFQQLQAKYGLNECRNYDERASALREYEEAHPEHHEELESSDQFYGYAGNAKLDPFIQWVYVPAVSLATDEQTESGDNALKRLLARTVRTKVNFTADLAQLKLDTSNRYQELMGRSQGALDDIADALTRRLHQWAHPSASLLLAWETAGTVPLKEPIARVVGGEGGFEGSLARFGNGFQRSYMIALLQELSATDAEDGPTLLLGCEEPELYQHPPQARHLATVLQKLSERNAQILLTTHSPYFVNGRMLESVRVVRRSDDKASAQAFAPSLEAYAAAVAAGKGKEPVKPEGASARLQEVLRPQLCEMFFARKVILVEGSEDVAYIMAWMTMSGKLDAFRSRHAHIVAVDGKSRLAEPLALAQTLGIPFFLMFDSDTHCSEKHREQHEQDNRVLLTLLGKAGAERFPPQAVWDDCFVQWPTDIASVIDAEISERLGEAELQAARDIAAALCGHSSGMTKNSVYIEEKLRVVLERGGSCPVLDRLCDAVLR